MPSCMKCQKRLGEKQGIRLIFEARGMPESQAVALLCGPCVKKALFFLPSALADLVKAILLE